MREWIQYKKQIKDILKNIQEIENEFSEKIKVPRLTKLERYNLESEKQHNLSIENDDMDWIKTQRLLRKANKLDIPIPYDCMIKTYSQENVLRIGKRFELKKQIRSEQRAKREPFFAWGALVVGVLSAVVSVFVAFFQHG